MSESDANLSLIVVGLGIEFLSHVSSQAKTHIEKTKKVLYLVNEPLTEKWLKSLRSCLHNLNKL